MSVLKYVKNIDTVANVYSGQEIAVGTYYLIQPLEERRWMNDSKLLEHIGQGKAQIAKDDTGNSDIVDINEQIVFLKGEVSQATSDNRPIVAVNRIPQGYIIYTTGKSDDIANGAYGAGNSLYLSKGTGKTIEFQSLEHIYVIGGRATWEDASNRDSIDALLYGPATVGVQQAGNFNKVEVIPSSGKHIYVPTTNGGAWDLDLTAKIPNTNILKCTLIPSPDRTGFFNYDMNTNVISVSNAQKGDYNLFDFNVDMFSFARANWGRKDNGETQLEVSDVVGKLLLNSWKFRYTLNIFDEPNRDPSVAIVMVTAVTKNL